MDIYILAAMALLIILFIAAILLTPEKHSGKEEGITIAFSPEDRKVVRVRSAGGPWMSFVVPYELGSDGESAPEIPQAVVARNEPELYAEYMAEGTSTDRRMELADILYGMGYTLPLHHDMYMRMREEMKASARAAQQKSEDSTPAKSYPRLEIDRSVADGLDEDDTDITESERTGTEGYQEEPFQVEQQNNLEHEQSYQTPDRGLGDDSPELRSTPPAPGTDIHGPGRP